MYQEDYLRNYIKESELRVFNNRIKVRLSSELAIKYDLGVYTNFLTRIENEMKMLDKLKIKYPANAKPILYIYVVPDDNFTFLLQMPTLFSKDKKSGGKPVTCYDLDGFPLAYGLSQNCLENKETNNLEIAALENELHELSHIVLSQFLLGNQVISEGIAETLPLYGLRLEEKFEKHKQVIATLEENNIYSLKELLNKQRDSSYGNDAVLPNMTCSFRLSYISSYLFVRGLLERVEEKYLLSSTESINCFFSILRGNRGYANEFLIYDIADALELSHDELLNKKDMQKKALNSIRRLEM